MCANHSILPWMDLRPNCGSQKVNVCSVSMVYFCLHNLLAQSFPLWLFTSICILGVGVEDSSRLCWCTKWGGQTKAGGELKIIIWNWICSGFSDFGHKICYSGQCWSIQGGFPWGQAVCTWESGGFPNMLLFNCKCSMNKCWSRQDR